MEKRNLTRFIPLRTAVQIRLLQLPCQWSNWLNPFTCGGRSINTTRRMYMQKLIDTLKSYGIEIPEDKQADVKKALSEHYKNAKEVAKTLSKVEGERDDWKERAETAEETLKGFDGIDPANIQTELAGWKKKAEDAEKEFNAKIYDRDFSDALKAALDDVKFSSEAAKKSVMADIKEAGLKLKDGKILGLNDLIDSLTHPLLWMNLSSRLSRIRQNLLLVLDSSRHREA
jgi:RNA polymerase-interacting CarD/CdnL/TRCF family regulator